MNAMPKKFTADEPAGGKARNGDQRDAWKIATKMVSNLQRMGRCNVVQRTKSEQGMHTNFILKQKRLENGKICEHNVRLVVCGNEEEYCRKKAFSPAVHQNVIRLILSQSVWTGLASKHIDFENALPNGVLKRTVYPKIRHRYSKKHNERAEYSGSGRICTAWSIPQEHDRSSFFKR